MSVSNGQLANETTFNNAFISRTVDTSTVGKLDLLNVAAASGATISNIQRALNSLFSAIGFANNQVYNFTPVWTSTVVGATDDTVIERSDLLSEKFHATTGHGHSGSAGDGGPILASSLTSVRLRGYFVRGTNLLAAAGVDDDVSTQMSGKTPSTGDTVKGVIVDPPNNRVVIRDDTPATLGDELKDAFGNTVYARITKAGAVWTLSYYTDVAGVETAYTMIAQPTQWYYQELFNPITDAPIYSELAVTPSDNATQDVIQATTSLYGKTILSGSASADTGSAGTAGTANGTVANADHVHRGVASFRKAGDTLLYGAVTLTGGVGITLTQAGQDISIASTGGGGGGSLQWIEDVNAPTPLVENSQRVYSFENLLAQALYAAIRVPNGYTAGSPIKLRMVFYNAGSSGNVLMNSVATLIRTGTDAVSSTTNQRTSTNAAVTLGAGTVNKPQAVIMDLTDSGGLVNGVAVAAGDLLLVKLQRDTDTAATDTKVPVYGAEVTTT